jgi:Ca2+-binding RTX toxin-like protein
MSIDTEIGAVVATPGEQVNLSALFSVTPAANNPTYLILSGLDRDEYTAAYNTADMGSLSGNGVTQAFSDVSDDEWSVGIVFTYQASTGSYYNATYGYLNQMTFTASSNTDDNVGLSIFTTNSHRLALADAADPYSMVVDPYQFTFAGGVSIVTQPSYGGPAPSQATPDSICATADSFIGQAWNLDGCWVLASNISAEAGASLPVASTLIGVPGVANGEWIVAYNGPVSVNAAWEQTVTAGEMVVFETTSGGGHITTVVSGSGASAMLVDNIVYVYGDGSYANAANDGSANDIIVSAPHPAWQEFDGVDPSMVVVYQLDTPTVTDLVTSATVGEGAGRSLAPLFTASNPLASQAITEWQVYNTNPEDAIAVAGVAQSADHSAADAATVASLSAAALLAGPVAGTDTIEVRAYNGSYWGDWQSLTASVVAPTPPSVTDQTAGQIWTAGQAVNLALAADTFTDPQGETLSYAASQSNGAALPAWLSFNGATDTFTGTAPSSTGSLTLQVTATDTSGLSASESFAITVRPPPIMLGSDAVYAVVTPDQTVVLGAGSSNVALQSTATLLYAASGTAAVIDAGGFDTIVGSSGSMTVNVTSGAPLVFGGTGSLFFSGGEGASTVVGGAGTDTIFANGGGGQFWGGGGPMLFVGGSGVSTAVGGAGASTLFGGSGQDLLVAGTGASTLIGGGSGAVIVGLGSNPDALVAGSGNETLVGSAGGGNDLMFAGTGTDAMFGGSGNDTFIGASGAAQMVAGAGQEVFLFSQGSAGGSAVIWNFAQGADEVALLGYGANAVSNALASATVAFGSTTISLPDNTRITFANIADLKASDFR